MCCPITHALFRDPVFVPSSGHTYEREALLCFWNQAPPRRDPLTNVPLESSTVYTNWAKRSEVNVWLGEHPDYVPPGWASRDLPPPAARPVTVTTLASWAPCGRLVRLCFTLLAVVLMLLAGLGLHEDIATGALQEDAAAGALENEDGLPFSAAARDEAEQAVRYADWASMPRAPQLQPLRILLQNGPPAGSRIEVALLLSQSSSPQVVGLRIRLPRAPPGSLATGDAAARSFFALLWLGFTAFWTSAAWHSGAPLHFMLFSAPFWVVGGTLLRGSILPLTESFELACDRGGLAIQRTSLITGTRSDHAPWTDIVGEAWPADQGGAELGRGVEPSWARAVEVRGVMDINGVELGELNVRHGVATYRWGRLLSMLELNFVRGAILEWGRIFAEQSQS